MLSKSEKQNGPCFNVIHRLIVGFLCVLWATSCSGTSASQQSSDKAKSDDLATRAPAINPLNLRGFVDQIAAAVKAGNIEERVETGFDRFENVKVIRGTFRVVLKANDAIWPGGELPEARFDGNPCFVYFENEYWRDGSPTYTIMVKDTEEKKNRVVAYPFKPGFRLKAMNEGTKRIVSWHFTTFARDGYTSLDLDSQNRLVSATNAYRLPLPQNLGQVFSDRTTDLTRCVFESPLLIGGSSFL